MTASSTESPPWLVAVSAGRWQLHGIVRAQNAGIRVLALDGDGDAPGLVVADCSAHVNIRDSDAVIKAVENSGIEPAGVISFASEVGQMAAAAIREKYGLAGPNELLTKKLTNKKSQRQAWHEAKLPNPDWQAVSTTQQAKKALDEIGFPAIIKPVDAAGSRGVTKLENMTQFDQAAADAFSHSQTGYIMLEEFIEGQEYTVETFSHKGRTYPLLCTEKLKVPGTKGTVANELRTPDMTPETMKSLEQTAIGALQAIGYTDGPGHTEIIVNKKGQPYLVETAGRGAGFKVFDAMVPRSSGYDLAQACAMQAVGLEPPQPEPQGIPVVLRFFPSMPGSVTSISGFEETADLEGVESGPFVEIGQRMSKANTDGDRLGYILSWGANRTQALERAKQAEGMISFEVEEWPA